MNRAFVQVQLTKGKTKCKQIIHPFDTCMLKYIGTRFGSVQFGFPILKNVKEQNSKLNDSIEMLKT